MRSHKRKKHWLSFLLLTLLFLQIWNCQKNDCFIVRSEYEKLSRKLCSSSDPDPDGDGICNSNEKILGTDQNIRDIFLEIDYMIDETDKGMTISKAMLDLVKNAFAQNNIALHIDVGTLFNGVDVYDETNYNLCGGNPVLLTEKIEVHKNSNTGHCNFGESCSYVTDIKKFNFSPSRENIFHYAVIGKTSAAGLGVGGSGELIGQNFYISLGCGSDCPDYYTKIWYDSQMAITIMHELGHNLGLSHAGNPANMTDNFHPNYTSIMNYAYGLGIKNSDYAVSWLNSRYYSGYCSKNYEVRFQNKGWDPLSEYAVLDYSKGLNFDLDELNINENTGFSPNGTPVDFNCDGSLTAGYSADLNADADGGAGISILKDFADWSNLILDIEAYYSNVARQIFIPDDSKEYIMCYRHDHIPSILKKYGYIPEHRIRYSIEKN